MAGNNPNIFTINDHEFNIIQKGLDPEQVKVFVEKLLEENSRYTAELDRMKEQVEHLDSLKKLADTTVIEADKLAARLKEEAVAKAKAESDSLIAKAEEKARKVYEQIYRQLSTLKQQVNSLDKDFDFKSEGTAVTAEPVMAAPVKETPVREQSDFMAKAVDTSDILESDTRELIIRDKEIELEILPPVDAVKITKIMDQLENASEVEVVELIPRPNHPVIIVYENKPNSLLDVLKKLSMVGKVNEIPASPNGSGIVRRKYEISLAANAVK
ncbi:MULTISPECIES: DivIVA domain-containing protein [Dehalococcoides]|jgi:DivIVA protein.|uniref:Cell division protein DivIVA n=2 Tax=root TaxID=1 RepID=A0AB33HST0_9CHLR|nr:MULTISPECIES: DivIVA domain-containing protein [Dehalococcoides]BAZ97461.1 cell division protein DivIVA [Dehalococcoides mccartyi]